MSLDEEEMQKRVQDHYLMNPMQELMHSFKRIGIFDDPIPKMFSNCSKACNEAIQDDRIRAAADIDDTLTAEDESHTHSNSKKKNMQKPIHLPKEVTIRMNEFQEKMTYLIDRMAEIRPLLNHERAIRIQALKFPTRIVLSVMREIRNQGKLVELRSRKRRKYLPPKSLQLMKDWLFANRQNPYPSPEEKKNFAQSGNLEIRQVDYWFTNARARLLRDREFRR
jgi:hypothetical protein